MLLGLIVPLVAACAGAAPEETAPPTQVAVVAPKPPAPPPPDPNLPTGKVPEAESDIARTFDYAFVALPPRDGPQALVTRMRAPALAEYLAAAPGIRYPTVLFLHGCDGLAGLNPLRAMARRGFAVVAPDSFARRFRPHQCDTVTRTGGQNLYVYDFRAAEISYALQRLRRLPWVDQRRLFLVGHSEGGLAAAQYRGDAFRARVIAEWTCHGSPLVAGLSAPPDEPVLAVVRANDPWYRRTGGRGQGGDCGAFMGPRPRSRSVVLRRGELHDVLSDAEGIGPILEFLEAEAKRAAYRGS